MWLTKLFKKENTDEIIRVINELEPERKKRKDEELKTESDALRERIKNGESLDDIIPEAFSLVREAAVRTLGQRHFDEQLMGGIALHQRKIAEMATGEGKTLAATAPAYLNALTGKGVHVITVNDYLARRDMVWMGQIYDALGVSVACMTHDGAFLYDASYQAEQQDDKERDAVGSFKIIEDFLKPVGKKEAYQADILYGTNHEFGFDYLRDNLVSDISQRVQRGHEYAIIDEVDSILIDEARTPLIISAPDAQSSDYYRVFSQVVRQLEPERDYITEEKMKSVNITDEGIDLVEKMLKINNIYAAEHLRLVHYLEESLRAKALFTRDKQYIVEQGAIVIIDEFTGRKMYGRRYSGGLHQALEAKEGLKVNQESRTFAQITIQNYFRLYNKIAGMTGTAQTSAEEFDKVYKLDVATIPTHRPVARNDLSDVVYKTKEGKYKALIEEVKKRHAAGQPILIGTISIEKNENLDALLSQANIPHEVLNAKNHEREGAIIAQAGKSGAVTVATNMAGRGVDIILGGNPQDPEDAKKVKEAGGLHIMGTERHEARRIDNQLRGRAGRQGDPGSSQFFLSLEDDLLRVFGSDRIKSMMETLKLPEDMPIESGMISKAVNEAQKKIEGFHFDSRKHLLEYDDILNKHRLTFYEKRNGILQSSAPRVMLSMLDVLWMGHLENMEALREAVSMRAYAQKEPLMEYKRESHHLFQNMMAQFEQWKEENKEKLEELQKKQEELGPNVQAHIHTAPTPSTQNPASGKVGRNDPCPCGAKKPDGTSVKYKHCHGK